MAGTNAQAKQRQEDGLEIYQDGIRINGEFCASGTRGLTASVTQTQVGATLLPDIYNVIATCATGSDAVRLPAGKSAGSIVYVCNRGAAAAGVWPPTSGKINNNTVNLVDAVTLAINGSRAYRLNDDLINWDWV